MLSNLPLEALPAITGIFVGAAAGYIGAFMVLRRMALVGDALSHVALPGVALALLYNFNPFLGAFAALFVAIIVIWFIEHRTELSTESLVGLLFTFALAIGLLITPEEDILHALIGDISAVTVLDALIAIALSIAVMLILYRHSRALILSMVSPDLARSSRINVAQTNFFFLILVAIIVALGIKVIGTLLMGALVVIPAIASKNLSRSFASYAAGSALVGMMSTVFGILIATSFDLPAGPVVVLFGSLIFAFSTIFKK